MKKLLHFFSDFKAEVIVIAITLLSLLIIFIISESHISRLNNSWGEKSSEKNALVNREFINYLEHHENSLIKFSEDINDDKKLISAISNSNIKKSYENFFDKEINQETNIEIYNSRFELILFYGRQVYPEIGELTKSISGKEFTLLKHIGYYTYLIHLSPYRTDSLSKTESEVNQFSGVIVSSQLIDIDHKIQNKLYNDFGITRDIYDKHGVIINVSSDKLINDAEINNEQQTLPNEIKSKNGDLIGYLYIPTPDKNSFIENVEKKYEIIYSFLFFILNLCIIFIVLKYLYKKTNNLFFYLGFIVLIIISRFFWLKIQFPALIFNEFNINIFTPAYFASSFFYGISSSIGELFISFIVILLIVYVLIRISADIYKGDLKIPTHILQLFAVLSLILFFLSIFTYGYIIQTLVYDSDLKYFDKSSIINTNNIELTVMQIAIVIITISLTGILLSTILIITRLVSVIRINNLIIKRNIIIPVILVLFVISYLLEFIADPIYLSMMKINIRNLIIISVGVFTYYFAKKLILNRNHSYLNILNISFLLFLCAVIIPVVMLNKISSQENKYLEIIARKVSEPIDDKIVFSILSTIEDLEESETLYLDLLDKNKYSRLAFNIWSESKISSEKLNSAIFVLDTNKKVISDFNINPADLLSDSVVNFALRNYEIDEINYEDTLIEEEAEIPEISDETMMSGLSEEIFENPEMKFYYGIKPIEVIDIADNSKSKTYGYIVVAAKYDSKNYLPQSSIEIFKNFSRDNIENKIISNTIISEFSDGELISSTDKEIARAFTKSLDLFRGSVTDRIDKSSWRYDEYLDELYKSFYIMTNVSKPNNSYKTEKIFIVSSKVNDFGIYSFYTFKFLIFITLIYLIVILLYFLYRLIGLLQKKSLRKNIKFGFREKLFSSFLIVSVIPIIILAVYTREFVQNKNNDFSTNQISSDLKIIEQYINSKLSLLENKNENRENNIVNFSALFGKNFSETHKNFNLFVKNKLAATTNEELYKSDLLDTRISGSAYYNIVILKKDFYIENQVLGNFQFVAGYKPLYDSYNNLLGIISSQSVFRQYEINQELTESLVYIFGTYFFTVIVLVFIVNLLSYKISNPIIKLLKATEQLSKGNTEIEIKTNNTDEIGELVHSFNRMTKELKRSRDELKKAERESAWRDIARQVAHEIKNPLTPMKLAMQHLYYAYSKDSAEFPEIIKKTNQLVIDQIETLNRIATEFSDFAKMPSRNYTKLNVHELLNDIVQLMYTGKTVKTNLDIKLQENDAEIFGDKDEVKRAFINILKNSMQAIEEKKFIEKDYEGKINIVTYRDNGRIKVMIKDDGIGMDDDTIDKLFEPYFSTKSKGMGLGLVITKKIVDDMKGNIKVESSYKTGTSVELSFNLLI